MRSIYTYQRYVAYMSINIVANPIYVYQIRLPDIELEFKMSPITELYFKV